MFANLGIPQEVVLFFGNYANSQFSIQRLFFGRDHSELHISRKDDGEYSKMVQYFTLESFHFRSAEMSKLHARFAMSV